MRRALGGVVGQNDYNIQNNSQEHNQDDGQEIRCYDMKFIHNTNCRW